MGGKERKNHYIQWRLLSSSDEMTFRKPLFMRVSSKIV